MTIDAGNKFLLFHTDIDTASYPHVTLEDGDEQRWGAKSDEALSPQSKLFPVGSKGRGGRSHR